MSWLLFLIATGSCCTDAEQAFRQGDYLLAAQQLDAQARASTERSGAFYFNQGNAHLLAGYPASAILAYRRAELLMPANAVLQENLAEARGRITGAEFSLYPLAPWWGLGWLPSGLVLLLNASVCGVCLWCGWHRRWPPVGLSFILGGWLVIAVWGGSRVLEDYQRQQAWVVLVKDVPLRQGNGTTYPVQEYQGKPLLLHAGVEGRVVIRRDNGWVLLELADNIRGWVPEQVVGHVPP